MSRRILLSGHSLALDSIAVTLKALPELELLHEPLFGESPAVAAERILAFEPTAVVFDLAAGFPDKALLRLLARTRVTLLGFDLESHHMLVLSGEKTRLLTTDDLLRILALTPEENACPQPSD